MSHATSASRRLAAGLSLATLAGTAPVCAQEVIELDAPALHGAWLVPTDPDHAADRPRTIAFLVVLAGERDNDGEPGLAHYAEHLVWESATRGRAAPGDGPDSNATTDLWSTAYFLDGPDDRLDATLGTLARALDPVDLDARFMREEVGVVQREYDLRVRESVDAALDRALDPLLYEGRWPGRSVIGTPESIDRLTPSAALAWQARTHRAANAVLVVHGAVPADAVEASIGRAFGTAPAEGRSLPLPGYATGPRIDTVLERVEPRLKAPEIRHVRVARLLGPPAERGDLEARRHVLYRALDSTRPGGIAGPLRYDDFLAASFDLYLDLVDASHVALAFAGRPDRGVTNAELADALRATLGDIARTGIPGESVERARALILAEYDAFERPDEVTLDAALSAVSHGARPESHAERRARIENVTVDEVNALLRALVDAPRVVTLLAEPGESR